MRYTIRVNKGGAGSGHFGHYGREGEVGGSLSGDTNITVRSGKWPKEAQKLQKIYNNLPDKIRRVINRVNPQTFVVTEVEKSGPDSISGGYYEKHGEGIRPSLMIGKYMRKGMLNGMMNEIFVHELGHVYMDGISASVSDLMKLPSFQKKTKLSERAQYNPSEHFAEAFRIYVTRPESLKNKEPDVYDFLDKQ